ncbi:MAG: sugar ABC transporter permease, partial [Lacisediminihabitans sp.]
MTTMSMRAGNTATPPRRRRRRDWRGWAFMAPFMIVFLAMIVAPVIYALYLSLFRQQLIGGNAFVGFDNYVHVFTDTK